MYNLKPTDRIKLSEIMNNNCIAAFECTEWIIFLSELLVRPETFVSIAGQYFLPVPDLPRVVEGICWHWELNILIYYADNSL